jgi:hypothetical protein
MKPCLTFRHGFIVKRNGADTVPIFYFNNYFNKKLKKKGFDYMQKVRRDTTRDLFHAVLRLVKENGHYDKAEAIMDYVLPEISGYNTREDIELSNYRFNFYATAQFGGSEGIYINCYLRGEYTETERKCFDASRTLITETMRSVGTFKTLKTDIESMKIMGELCGALVFYATQYVNKNISRYAPAKELIKEERVKNAELAREQYVSKHSLDLKEVYKHSFYNRYNKEKDACCYDWLDTKYTADKDCFEEYVNVLTVQFSMETEHIAGIVFTWLCTRQQEFKFNSEEA